MPDLYEATFSDAEGAPFTSRFRAAVEADALAIADAIALKSDAQWQRLRRLRELTLPFVPDSGPMNGVDITPNANAAAGAGSDVQSRGKFTYNTAVAGNYVSIEIPSVDSGLLSKGSRTTTTDPLGAETDSLASENGALATTLRKGHYIKRVRRS